MSNTHGSPDVASELQATCGDLLAASILTSTIALPASAMTFAPFATAGYVRNGSPVRLVYVNQPPAPITLVGGAGTYWIALHHDTHTAVATWTRQAGTHYLWQMTATPPSDPPGGLILASATVAGGVVTAINSAYNYASGKIAYGATGGGLAFDSKLTWDSVQASLAVQGAASYAGSVGIGGSTISDARATIWYPKGSHYGLLLRALTADTGHDAIIFVSIAGGATGSISTTATTTAFNTSSDVRLKSAITALTGALAVVQALRPVAFRWNADDSQGHGFLAHELQQVIPDAVTGEPDAVNADGSVKPQGVDHSKLVPWLTACCQELAAQVQALTARVTSLEQQLGV